MPACEECISAGQRDAIPAGRYVRKTANAVRPGTIGIRIERPNNNYGYYEENEDLTGFSIEFVYFL